MEFSQGWMDSNSFTLYQIKKDGLLLGKRGKSLKSYNDIKKAVHKLGYKPKNGQYSILKSDIERWNSAIQLINKKMR